MKKNRPINYNLVAFKWPITAISSGLHRISGVILFFCIPLCLWALQKSLTPNGFVEIKSIMSGVFMKMIFWAVLSMLAYHIIAGIRHLLMDAGIGESLEGGKAGSYTVLVLGVLMTAVIGVWIW